MNKGLVFITAGGSILVLAVLVGSGVFVKNIMDDLYTQQATSLADSSSFYEDNYTDAMNVQLLNAQSDENVTGETNVQITHNNEVVSDIDVSDGDTVTVDITKKDDAVSVVVLVPKPPEPIDEEIEIPRIINGKTIYLSDVTETLADGTVVYYIQKGDTLCYISTLLGFSVDELAKYNCVKNPNLIYAHSVLRIPER